MSRILFVLLALLASHGLFAQQSLVLQPDNEAGKDAWIWSLDRFWNTGFGAENGLDPALLNVVRAESWVWADEPDTIRGFIQFPLEELPEGAVVQKASLSLFFFANTSFTRQVGENALEIRRVTEAWDERYITWKNQPSVSNSDLISVARSSSETQDYTDLDVTELVKSQLKQGNHGFRLSMREEVPFKGLSFASSKHPSAELRPRLLLEYELISSATVVSEPKLPVSYSDGLLHLRLPSPQAITQYGVYSLDGRQIKTSGYASISKTVGRLKVALTPGVYIVKLRGEKSAFAAKLLVR